MGNHRFLDGGKVVSKGAYLKRKAMEELNREISTCTRCRLHKSRTHTVPGEGSLEARLFFVGQGPGRSEDASGRPFIGRAGRFLDKMLNSVGLERSTVYLTSCVKCFPPHNRKPRRDEIEACRPYLERQLSIIDPAVVVLLGDVAVETLLGESGVSRFHGELLVRGGRKFFATYHPAAGVRFPQIRRIIMEDLRGLRRAGLIA